MLWLTQRLLRRLLPHLCHWLQAQPVPVATPPSPQALVLQPHLVQQMAQQVAQVALHAQQQTPVQAPPRVWSGVVTRAQLQLQPPKSSSPGQAARMQVCWQVSESAQFLIAFAAAELRQWLGIVYRQFQAAQWPLDIWPQWLSSAVDEVDTDAGTDALPPSADMLH